MSMFNPNETQQAHEARKNAAIASPTSPNADRSGYQASHIADTVEVPGMAAPPAMPIGLGAPQQEEPRPIGF